MRFDPNFLTAHRACVLMRAAGAPEDGRTDRRSSVLGNRASSWRCAGLCLRVWAAWNMDWDVWCCVLALHLVHLHMVRLLTCACAPAS